MNQSLKNSVAFFGNLLPFSLLNSEQNYPPFLPFYHVVCDETLDYINSYVVRSQHQFEKELDYLLKYFTPVSLQDILEAPHKSKMHLTFDDGLKECSTIIAPILKQKGIPATFFVSPAFVDNQDIFHRFKRAILESKGILQKGNKKFFLSETNALNELAKAHQISFSDYKPYMSLADIQGLTDDGFTIGAHSLNHPEMWLLSEDEQFRQVAESMQWVVNHFDSKIKAFSFPFTDDGLKLSLFRRLQQEQVVDITFGTAGLKYDQAKNHWQRIPVELAVNWNIKKVVHFEYFYFKIRNLFSANTVRRD